MSKGLKGLVSKKKRRFKDKDFDLDLSYINSRVIAMGYPSVGKEAVYRNPRQEVVRFLDTRHGEHYKVYNLCSERQYDASVFHGRVARYPFDDHNCPPLSLLYACCQDVGDFLKADPRNVVALHCKAGKGRTGLLITCWLLWNNDWEDAPSALAFYAAARTHNQKGVTIPSQIRYTEYFDRALHRSNNGYTCPPLKLLMLERVVLRNFPVPAAGAEVSVKIRAHGKTTVPATVLSWKGLPEVMTMGNKNLCDLSLGLPTLPLRGDIHVRVETKSHSFMFWFNTFFYTNELRLSKAEIDKAAKDKGLSSEFCVELGFGSGEEVTALQQLDTKRAVGVLGVKKIEYRYPESLLCL